MVDVTTDRDVGGLQVNVIIDRLAALFRRSDNLLKNPFSQRQISTIYGPRNQYRVILQAWTASTNATPATSITSMSQAVKQRVPLSAVTMCSERGNTPTTVNHQGQFPAVTITYNLAPGAPIEDVTVALSKRSPNYIFRMSCAWISLGRYKGISGPPPCSRCLFAASDRGSDIVLVFVTKA